MSKRKVYIAGPMTGYPEFNFPAFFAAEKLFNPEIYEVLNPAKKEEEDVIKDNDPEAFANGRPGSGTPFKDLYRWDLNAILDCDAIFMLEGWQYSPGACGEHAVAVALKRHNPDFDIFYE